MFRPDRRECAHRLGFGLGALKAIPPLEVPSDKAGPPVACGRADAVNMTTARGWTGKYPVASGTRSNIVRSGIRVPPRWQYSSRFSLKCVVARILPVRT